MDQVSVDIDVDFPLLAELDEVPLALLAVVGESDRLEAAEGVEVGWLDRLAAGQLQMSQPGEVRPDPSQYLHRTRRSDAQFSKPVGESVAGDVSYRDLVG